MPVLEDIAEWANRQPAWTRHLLRAVVTDNLDDPETFIANVAHLLEEGDDVPPIHPSELRRTAGGPSARRLMGLDDVQHARRLLPGCNIDFASPALNAILGPNGTGKSTFAWLMARAAGSRLPRRFPRSIPSNVYAPPPQEHASVRLRVADEDGVESTHAWRDGDDPVLGFLSVFTQAGQSLYLDTGTLRFAPFGIDLAAALGSALRIHRERIGHRLEDLERECSSVPFAGFDWDNVEGDVVRGAIGAIDEPGFTTITFTDANECRLRELEQLFSSVRGSRQAVEALTAWLKGAEVVMRSVKGVSGPAFVAEVDAALRHLREVRESLRLASADDGTESGARADRVGGAAWRRLYEAARAYQTEGLESARPNGLADAPHCVLCSQELDDEARDRLGRFDRFVQLQLKEGLDQAEAECVQLVQRIDGVSWSELHDLLRNVPKGAAAVGDALRELHPSLITRRDAMKTALTSRMHVFEGDAMGCSFEPIDDALVAAREQLQARRGDLEGLDDPQRREELNRERRRLRATKLLATKETWIREQARARWEKHRLEQARGRVQARGVSNLVKQLEKTYVTERVTRAFNAELQALNVGTIRASLEPRTRAGQVVAAAALVGCPQNARIEDVASEGEGKAIALAAFLAEASLSDETKCLVFDDPMSSMDRERSALLAHRLARLASQHQVIVFTHDAVFYSELHDAAAKDRVDIATAMTFASTQHVGCVDYSGMDLAKASGVNQAIDEIRRRSALLTEGDSDSPARASEDASGLAREARVVLERFVEVVILARTVQRYRRSVAVGSLARMITDSEILDEVLDLHAALSRFHHDDGRGAALVTVDPEVVHGHINRLFELRERVSQARSGP